MQFIPHLFAQKMKSTNILNRPSHCFHITISTITFGVQNAHRVCELVVPVLRNLAKSLYNPELVHPFQKTLT